MYKRLLVIATVLLFCFSVSSQLVDIPWNDVIVLGQNSYTTRTSSLSATGLSQPPSLGVVGNYLIVSDYNNSRVVAYSLTNIANGAAASFALNANDLSSRGSYSSNGIEPYSENGSDYVWIGTASTDATLNNRLVRYTLPITSNNQAADPITFSGVTFSTPQGVEIDTVNQLLYAVDTGNNRVLQYSTSDLSTPLRIYGQSSISNNRPNRGVAVSATGLYNPAKVVLGCNNDLFIVDSRNSRILRFSNTNTTANAVIGQVDFVTRTTGNTANRLNVPVSAVINEQCTFMWVADTENNRVLKFDLTNGVTNGMAAVGVLGQVGNAGPAINRFTPTDLDLDERNQYMWIADFSNNRVLGGNTADVSSVSPSATTTATASVSSTSSASFSSTATASFSSTATASFSSTATASFSSTATASFSSTSTASVSPSSVASQSATSTASVSASSVASLTSSPSASYSASPVPSVSPSAEPTVCPTRSPLPTGCSSTTVPSRCGGRTVINFYFADMLRGI